MATVVLARYSQSVMHTDQSNSDVMRVADDAGHIHDVFARIAGIDQPAAHRAATYGRLVDRGERIGEGEDYREVVARAAAARLGGSGSAESKGNIKRTSARVRFARNRRCDIERIERRFPHAATVGGNAQNPLHFLDSHIEDGDPRQALAEGTPGGAAIA